MYLRPFTTAKMKFADCTESASAPPAAECESAPPPAVESGAATVATVNVDDLNLRCLGSTGGSGQKSPNTSFSTRHNGVSTYIHINVYFDLANIAYSY